MSSETHLSLSSGNDSAKEFAVHHINRLSTTIRGLRPEGDRLYLTRREVDVGQDRPGKANALRIHQALSIKYELAVSR